MELHPLFPLFLCIAPFETIANSDFCVKLQTALGFLFAHDGQIVCSFKLQKSP